ncbi:MAG: hypothetical protein WAO19_13585 [Candidatus Kryptoniota bacterium]
MTIITDEYMKQMLSTTKNYCVLILKPGPNRNKPGAEKIIWEHGRRNFLLRADGKLSIVCPVSGGRELAGIGIFNASVDETKKIMDDDPAVKEKILVYDVYSCRGFPGDSLPE